MDVGTLATGWAGPHTPHTPAPAPQPPPPAPAPAPPEEEEKERRRRRGGGQELGSALADAASCRAAARQSRSAPPRVPGCQLGAVGAPFSVQQVGAGRRVAWGAVRLESTGHASTSSPSAVAFRSSSCVPLIQQVECQCQIHSPADRNTEGRRPALLIGSSPSSPSSQRLKASTIQAWLTVDDVKTKGKDALQPRADMIKEQIAPLRSWAEEMSRKWHFEGNKEAKEKSVIIRELSRALGSRTTPKLINNDRRLL
ncbi:uncharacterized protein [Miscanthus floridulus]|uniref:uncharacterized protein n=1 Tax=Miscanthus floridulus TaxID=154761 RepID=UPI00345AC832